MLVERAELTVREGGGDEMLAVLADRAAPLLRNVASVRSVRFGRGVEDPDKFILLVEWETLDAHTAFNQHPDSKALGEMLMPLVRGGAMEHFELN